MNTNFPKATCVAAEAVLGRLTGRLAVGETRTLREPSGVHMALHVFRGPDCPSGPVFSLSHRHASRGGGIADPEIALLSVAGRTWIPFSFQTPFTRVVTVDVLGEGLPVIRPEEQARLVQIVDAWMANVAANLLGEGGLEEEIGCLPAYAAE